jgi:hypothetical protein
VKKSAGFHCVRGTQAWANRFKVDRVPMVVVADADGDEIHRATFGDEASLAGAMDAALAKYAPKPVSWSSEPPASADGRKLLVVGFDDEKGEALKVLEDRTIVKYHASCTFVKLAFEKDGEAAKKWGVTSAPAIVLCDPSKESVLERLTGKKTPLSLKAAFQRALARVK